MFSIKEDENDDTIRGVSSFLSTSIKEVNVNSNKKRFVKESMEDAYIGVGGAKRSLEDFDVGGIPPEKKMKL